MRIFIILIAVIFYSSNLLSQEQRVEKIYQECMYNALPDKGIFFKNQQLKFEQHLIEKQVLKDASAEAYYTLFTEMQSGKDITLDFHYSFNDSIATYSKDYLILTRSNQKCIEKMQQLPSFKTSKLNNLNVNSFSISNFAIDDFELDFYKNAILFVIEKYKLLNDFEKELKEIIDK